MTDHRCIKCNKELDNICYDCAEEELEQSFHQASLEKEKTAKKYRLIPIADAEDDPK